jgi:hypothetical protein
MNEDYNMRMPICSCYLSVPCRSGIFVYMLQTKAKGKVCNYTLAPEPASLLREGSGAVTCSRHWTPPLCLGGLQRCYVSRGFRPCLTIQEGSGVATHPSPLDLASPLRRVMTLTRVLRLWTALALDVGSGADTCPMPLHRPWVVEIKKSLAINVCSKACVFLRHVRVLPRRL